MAGRNDLLLRCLLCKHSFVELDLVRVVLTGKAKAFRRPQNYELLLISFTVFTPGRHSEG